MLGGCKTGDAKLTSGHRLPARFVIHTVGPVWNGGTRGEPELLAACYRNSLRVATSHDVTSIAFPSISTGIYRYPVEAAAEIAVSTCRSYLDETATSVNEVIFCCFSASDLAIYEALLTT